MKFEIPSDTFQRFRFLLRRDTHDSDNTNMNSLARAGWYVLPSTDPNCVCIDIPDKPAAHKQLHERAIKALEAAMKGGGYHRKGNRATPPDPSQAPPEPPPPPPPPPPQDTESETLDDENLQPPDGVIVRVIDGWSFTADRGGTSVEEYRIPATELGRRLGHTKRQTVIELIERNKDELEAFGRGPLHVKRVSQLTSMPNGGVRVLELDEYYLNEDQALLIAMFSKTVQGAIVRAGLMEACKKLRELLAQAPPPPPKDDLMAVLLRELLAQSARQNEIMAEELRESREERKHNYKLVEMVVSTLDKLAQTKDTDTIIEEAASKAAAVAVDISTEQIKILTPGVTYKGKGTYDYRGTTCYTAAKALELLYDRADKKMAKTDMKSLTHAIAHYNSIQLNVTRMAYLSYYAMFDRHQYSIELLHLATNKHAPVQYLYSDAMVDELVHVVEVWVGIGCPQEGHWETVTASGYKTKVWRWDEKVAIKNLVKADGVTTAQAAEFFESAKPYVRSFDINN